MSSPYNIVLDLDETLIHTSDKGLANCLRLYQDGDLDLRQRTFMLFHERRPHEKKVGSETAPAMWAVKRRGLEEFLDFCFRYFQKVIVWSAGQKLYVEEVCKNLFPAYRQPFVIYSREHCSNPESSCGKPIEFLTQEFPDINLTNTFILDDRQDICEYNRYGGICIPAFSPEGNLLQCQDVNDDRLYQLMNWLNRIPRGQAAGALNKSKIFS